MNAALLKKLLYPLGGKALLLRTPDPTVSEQLGLSAEDAEQAGAEAKADAEAGTFDFVLLFARDIAALKEGAPLALKAVKRDGLLWICYPKGTSKMKSDLSRDRGWETVASADWEGVTLVSFDETWSAMRFRPAGHQSWAASITAAGSPPNRRKRYWRKSFVAKGPLKRSSVSRVACLGNSSRRFRRCCPKFSGARDFTERSMRRSTAGNSPDRNSPRPTGARRWTCRFKPSRQRRSTPRGRKRG